MDNILPIIILSSGGLAAAICYLVYQLVILKYQKKRTCTVKQEEKYEYADEYEDGDSLVIKLKNY